MHRAQGARLAEVCSLEAAPGRGSRPAGHLERRTLAEAEQALERFSARWDEKYPAISPSWRADWSRLTVFFDYPPQIWRAIDTTNAIESLNYSLRKVLKNRGAFPTDEAIFKALYLALNNITKKWTQPIRDWKAALNQFVILFAERMPK